MLAGDQTMHSCAASPHLGALPYGGLGLELLGGEHPVLGVEVVAGDGGQGQVRVMGLGAELVTPPPHSFLSICTIVMKRENLFYNPLI